jgi:hypothetical protein
MSVDHSHDSDPIEQLLLTAYPNPERKGCPGWSVLESLANQKRDQSDPNWYHIWHCSPCFAEFKELRDARWERERLQAQRRRKAIWGTVAAATCLAMVFVFWRVRTHRGQVPAQVAQIRVDLSNIETQRGASQEMKLALPPLPRAIDDVHIILPLFSEPGTYTVAVLRSKRSNSALVLATSRTIANGQRLELNIRFNLLNAPTGDYLLGTRFDDGDLIYYYPLRIQ